MKYRHVGPLQYTATPTPEPYSICEIVNNIAAELNNCLKTHDMYVVNKALSFIARTNDTLYSQIAKCVWTYACAPGPLGSQPWSLCIKNIQHVLLNIKRHPQIESNWTIAAREWEKFAFAITSGCCNQQTSHGIVKAPKRWVIQKTPNVSPYFSRTICMPTTEPDLVTRRSYDTRGECEMALSQLPPQQDYVPITTTTACNNYGCDNQIKWGRKPSYVVECIDPSKGDCGPSLSLGERTWSRTGCQ